MEVVGLDLSKALDNSTPADVKSLFNDAGILLFRDQDLTEENHGTPWLPARGPNVPMIGLWVKLPLFLSGEHGLKVGGTSVYVWIAILASFCGYVGAGFIHNRIGRRLTFSIYFIGSALAVVVFPLLPVGGTVGAVFAAFPLGFFAASQTAGPGAYLAELHPTEIRATGQALTYSAGRGVSGLATSTVGGITAALGLGPAITTVGICASALALIFLWTLPETKGWVIVEEEARA